MNESNIAADGWFAVTALVAGILVALVVYLRTRPGRVVPLLALAVGGGLGAVVAWRTGVLLGPAAAESRAKGLAVGTRFDGPLELSALGVLLAWPMGAVITYFAVAAGAETSDAVGAADPQTNPELDAGEPDAVTPVDGAAPSGPR